MLFLYVPNNTSFNFKVCKIERAKFEFNLFFLNQVFPFETCILRSIKDKVSNNLI